MKEIINLRDKNSDIKI